MNALILLAQAFFDHQARTQAAQLKEAGLRAAETGRRMALAGVFFATAGIFIFTALVVAVIELGLQIDRASGIGYSGLMVSASLFLLIGLFAAFGGWFAGREPKPEPVAPTPPPTSSVTSELRPLLEAVAVSLLRDFLEAQKAKHPTTPSAEPERDSGEAL